MIIFQEAAGIQLPKLSQSSLYEKFDRQSQISQRVRDTIANKEAYVKPANMKDIMALIRLNGSPIAKRAVEKFEKGDMVIIFDKDRSKIPTVLPFIVIQYKQGKSVPYVFADRVVTNLTSGNEYPNLMATMEAAYLAAALQSRPTSVLLNRQLVLNLCELYLYLWLMPLEQKLYVKGDNLTRAELYVIAYFYRMIDGSRMSAESIPFKRFLRDKIPDALIKQIVTEVQMMPSLAIGNLIKLIQQINPVRYKNLDATFMTYFTSSCGIPMIFALENLQYLFLLMTSSYYKTKITQYSLNKTALESSRKCMKTIGGMGLDY